MFEVAEENGRTQKRGEIKTFERENFEEEYDLELPKNKSYFPFIADYKNGKLTNPIKVKIIDETNSGYFVTYSSIKAGYVFHIDNDDNVGILINKNKINEFKKIFADNSKELYNLYKEAGLK
jgi:hypothetical protein